MYILWEGESWQTGGCFAATLLLKVGDLFSSFYLVSSLAAQMGLMETSWEGGSILKRSLRIIKLALSVMEG